MGQLQFRKFVRVAGSEYFDSPQQLRPPDSRGRSWPTTAHLATWGGDLRDSHSSRGQSFCGSPRLSQSPVQSNESVLLPPKSSMSGWWHHPRPPTLVVKLSLCHVFYRWYSEFPALATACCILHAYSFPWQQHPHHSGEARNVPSLQKPGCMPFLHPKVGCHIFQMSCFRWQQHCHHSAEALYENNLQKTGCMQFPHAKLGCHIFQMSFFRWQQRTHHSGEALYDTRLQKPGCMPFPHPELGCCIVKLNCLRWQQHSHHSGEALYESRLQKPGRMPFPHPELGCCIDQIHWLRWQKHCHHSGEALYDSRLQKPGCMPFPHPELGCCIVSNNCLRWQQHSHHSGEALYVPRMQKPERMPFQWHPKLGRRIVQLHFLRRQQHCHHSAEALYEHSQSKPLLEAMPIWSKIGTLFMAHGFLHHVISISSCGLILQRNIGNPWVLIYCDYISYSTVFCCIFCWNTFRYASVWSWLVNYHDLRQWPMATEAMRTGSGMEGAYRLVDRQGKIFEAMGTLWVSMSSFMKRRLLPMWCHGFNQHLVKTIVVHTFTTLTVTFQGVAQDHFDEHGDFFWGYGTWALKHSSFTRPYTRLRQNNRLLWAQVSMLSQPVVVWLSAVLYDMMVFMSTRHAWVKARPNALSGAPHIQGTVFKHLKQSNWL